jgi:NADP-dependent 3-hydroxy acid dehydrogenase YdfG
MPIDPSGAPEAASPLAGQVALVTGASGGIGSALAQALAREGLRLCLAGRDPATLAAAARLAEPQAPSVSVHRADLAIDGDVRRLVAGILAEHGRVDILVHAAGAICVGRTQDAPVEAFDRQYQVNVRAAYLLTQMLLPALRQQQGQIVFINSSVGLTGKAGAGQYAATKHALKAFADSLRQEVNAEGVRVTSVFPGQTASPMQAGLYRIAGKVYAPERLLQPADVAEVVVSALRLPRTAEVTDISVRPMQNPSRPN